MADAEIINEVPTEEAPKGDPRQDPQSRIKEVLQKATEANQLKDKALKEAEEAKREAQFYKGFNPLITKYQGAAELQDKIKEKVLAGYDIEDATVSVLNREGKLNTPTPVQEREIVAGGSATTPPTTGKAKPVTEMSQSERWEELKRMEKEGRF